MANNMMKLANKFNKILNNDTKPINRATNMSENISKIVSILETAKNNGKVLSLETISHLIEHAENDAYINSIASFYTSNYGNYINTSFELGVTPTLKDAIAIFTETVAYFGFGFSTLNSDFTKNELVTIETNNKFDKFIKIDLISKDELENLCVKVMKTPVLYSGENKEILELFREINFDRFLKELKDVIPYLKIKENIITLLILVKDFDNDEFRDLTKSLKTSTDILRLIYSLKNIELTKNPVKLRLTSGQAKLVISLLDKLNQSNDMILEDMASYRNNWLSLARNIHPWGKKSTNKVREIFSNLRYKNYSTFNSRVEEAFKISSLEGAKALSKKPGVLLRTLNRIIKNMDTSETDIEELENTLKGIDAKDLNPKIVINLIKFLEHRANVKSDKRVIRINTVFFEADEKIQDKLPSHTTKIVNDVLTEKLLDNLKNKELF